MTDRKPDRKPKDVGVCSCCDKEFPDCSLGAFGDDCVLCENCLATGIPKLKEQLASKDKQIAGLKEQLSKANIDWFNTEAEKNDLKSRIANIRRINNAAAEGCAGYDECAHCQIMKALGGD